VIEKLLIALVSGIFSAGVAWGMLKQLRRDVNGLGRKVNRLKDMNLAFCPPDQRREIANFLDH